MQMTAEKSFDLSFIGAGLSCSYSLIHFINVAEQSGRKYRYRILIIDKTNEFWTGIPYGVRSGFESLTITSLKEFIPPGELEIFIEWLMQDSCGMMSDNPKSEDYLFPSWIVRNREAISTNQWERIFIPRYLFGIYLNERMKVLLEKATKKGILEYELVTAEVTDVEKLEAGYAITANGEKGPLFFKTRKVILSIGSPPKKHLNNINGSLSSPLFVENMYEPNLQQNVEQIDTYLKILSGQRLKNAIILGSNASALEMLYNLYSAIDLKHIHKFYILSPDGVFPSRINDDNRLKDYVPINLTYLKNQSSYTSAQILEAVKKDTEMAQKENISLSDIFHAMSEIIIELLNKLSFEEQKKFVSNDGVQIGRFQRRAGKEYLDIVDTLIQQDKIEFIRGRFTKLIEEKEHQFTIEYFEAYNNQSKTFPAPIDIIINCVGFQELDNSSSELIRNLIKKKICIVNDSKRGFEVNERFESCKDFFVIGPLLAGNLNSRLRVWHAESCPRIFSLSQQLAEVLNHALQNRFELSPQLTD
jgi:uncharacterized NAD(P)/FAD-binding protein YdhS